MGRSGDLRMHRVGGEAEVKNTNGTTHRGRVDGQARVVNANGDIFVDYAGSPFFAWYSQPITSWLHWDQKPARTILCCICNMNLSAGRRPNRPSFMGSPI